jgi:molybdopterin-guanine dinucleotide biosynthesis protein A
VKKIGVVLAGGQSSRMGKDKASLIYHGKTLREHMTELLERSGADTVWISGKDGIKDTVAIGPLGGVLACLDAASDDAVLLFCPVDMPLLSVATLRALFDCTEPTTLAPGPLPLLLPATMRDAIRAQTNHSLRAIGARAIDIGSEEERRNINTPAEFEALP